MFLQFSLRLSLSLSFYAVMMWKLNLLRWTNWVCEQHRRVCRIEFCGAHCSHIASPKNTSNIYTPYTYVFAWQKFHSEARWHSALIRLFCVNTYANNKLRFQKTEMKEMTELSFAMKKRLNTLDVPANFRQVDDDEMLQKVISLSESKSFFLLLQIRFLIWRL